MIETKERVSLTERIQRTIRKTAQIGLCVGLMYSIGCTSKQGREKYVAEYQEYYTIQSNFEGIRPQKITWYGHGGVCLFTDFDNDNSFDLKETWVADLAPNNNKPPVSIDIKKGYEKYLEQNPVHAEKIRKLKENSLIFTYCVREPEYFDNLRIH